MDLTKTQIVEVLGLFLLIFILIFILAVLTPKLAKICDRIIGKLFKKNNADDVSDIYKVRSIYDAPSKNTLNENNNNNGEEKNGEE
ncbi:MAG: hypothetical protein IJA12_00735 [Oscillospiraceae bacterium]|nr:hypothetical protein [Oscillospiraceae bacterium]